MVSNVQMHGPRLRRDDECAIVHTAGTIAVEQDRTRAIVVLGEPGLPVLNVVAVLTGALLNC